MMPRLGWHLLLALVLLMMQQASLRHPLEHLVRQDGHPAHSTPCKDCLAYAAIDALSPNAPAVITPTGGHDALPQGLEQAQCEAAPALGYQTRAPPRAPLLA